MFAYTVNVVNVREVNDKSCNLGHKVYSNLLQNRTLDMCIPSQLTYLVIIALLEPSGP